MIESTRRTRFSRSPARLYRTGQASFEVVVDCCALLVIDMQDEFVKPGWTPYWVPEATRMVPRVAAFIAQCRKVGIPIVFTAFAATHRRLDRPRSGGVHAQPVRS